MIEVEDLVEEKHAIPEHNLAAAILIRALLDLQHDSYPIRLSARQFFLYPPPEHPFNCKRLCDEIGINYKQLRAVANDVYSGKREISSLSNKRPSGL